MMRIGDELVSRGHEVAALFEDWDLAQLRPVLPATNVSFIVTHPYETVDEGLEKIQHFWNVQNESLKVARDMAAQYGDSCRRLLGDAGALADIEAFRADIVFLDFGFQCGALLADTLQLPSITFAAQSIVEPFHSRRYGFLAPPATVPAMSTGVDVPTNFLERAFNWAVHRVLSGIVDPMFGRVYASIRRDFGLPSPAASPPPRLVLVNSSPPLQSPRQLPEGFKLLPPVMTKPAQPLTGELADLAAASAPEGFVYVSFGTVFGLSDRTSVGTLATALASLNRTVLWQVNDHTLPDGITLDDLKLGPNVHIVPWVPQNDVLGSPAAAAFVSHGGSNAIAEAMFHGVPVVSVPLVADHADNAARAARVGAGVVVSRRSLARGKADPVVEAVRRVTGDPAFRQRAREAGALLRAHPVPPVCRAAEWIEAALAMPPGAGLPVSDPAASLWWFLRESHDVHLAVAAVAAAVTAAVAAAGRWAAARARRALGAARRRPKDELKKMK